MSIEYKRITPAENPTWDVMESIIIDDCGEPLVPASMSSIIKTYPIYYKMGVGHAVPECFVRRTVLDKLVEAAKQLPTGIHLVILDGWRPYAVQQVLYDTVYEYFRTAPEHQGSGMDTLVALTRNIASPARTDPTCPSPHLTGGAVDVTLCDDAGQLLDMGTVFDENSPLAWTAALEDRHSNQISQEALNNRRMLYYVMTQAGFTNLPSEWWHFDYGDQLWAYFKHQSTAIYGGTKPLALERLWR
ncbi:D-alanyl-D-alanine dipeptidase [Vibrio sp. CAIM 722]|uniref:D-alanyl-D-alanine dipeptidase n=1 Tax=Vibrio eleionomae TaxID=2653505 RepID=A0A7X4LJ78_9VIBR|nr:M15 family metallopeptidase [Vibrio eleionomae]MZI92750.1 D-alanyl-D-alanine dipeptidase [Vibrio eleionomae]